MCCFFLYGKNSITGRERQHEFQRFHCHNNEPRKGDTKNRNTNTCTKTGRPVYLFFQFIVPVFLILQHLSHRYHIRTHHEHRNVFAIFYISLGICCGRYFVCGLLMLKRTGLVLFPTLPLRLHFNVCSLKTCDVSSCRTCQGKKP